MHPSGGGTSPAATLADYLQQLTETLAATHTHHDVLQATLAPAIVALGAISGAILLLDLPRSCLTVEAVQGTEARTLWQDGPLTPETPAGDALLHQRPLYFEHAGALKAVYPQLEKQVGGIAAVATAVLPLLLEGQGLGVLILDFREPHEFSAEERRFLTTLSAQCSVALGRARLIEALQTSEARFHRLVEASPVGVAVGSIDGRLIQVNDTYLRLLGYTRTQFESGELDWQALTPAEYQAQDAHAFDVAFREGAAAPYEKEMLTRSGTRLPLSLTLMRYDERQVVGYVQDLRVYKAEQQVSRDEQARLNQMVDERRADLRAEQEALQAFVTFTEVASHIEDLDALTQLALDMLRTVLPESQVVFYDLRDGHWWVRQPPAAATSPMPPVMPELALDTPALAQVTRTRKPLFLDGWTEVKQPALQGGEGQTVGLYPLLQDGEVCGALSVLLPTAPYWSLRNKSVVNAVGRSFALLYDRVATARQMLIRKEEAERRTQVMEAFAQLTTDLVVQQDDLGLIRQAQEVVLRLLPHGHTAYWEPEGGLWRMRVFTNEVGHTPLQAMLETGLPVGQTPTLDRPWDTGEAFYQDQYAGGTDVHLEMTTHIHAVAALPVRQEGRIRGIINFTTFGPYAWGSPDRAMLTTVVRSLQLALERSQSLRLVTQRSAELERSNIELRTSNQELEAFTYSASHDLRTPVRHVKGFAELAVKAEERGQSEKLKGYLHIIAGAADRMTAMIDAMLALSLAGRAELQLQVVPLLHLVEQARRDVQSEFPDQEVMWEIGTLPSVLVDAATMQQVMTNLVSNAVKFHRPGTTPLVRIWSEEREGELVVLVQDEGVGFDALYAEKLFGAFQRLHTQQEFSGTGIGLATVRRIVTRHGGRVWAEGVLHQGATFGLSLPFVER